MRYGELAAAEHLLSTYSAHAQGIKLPYNYGFWKQFQPLKVLSHLNSFGY
jgi:hypothetical protein